jgi:hypothetical protein
LFFPNLQNYGIVFVFSPIKTAMVNDFLINSTDNNEYSDGDRDETMWEEGLFDIDIPVDDAFSLLYDSERPEYSEEGYRRNIGE